MKLALLQLNSSAEMAANISAIEVIIREAVARGAECIATPENTFLMEEPHAPRALYNEAEHPGVLTAREWAKEFKVTLLIGSVAIKGDSEKTYNRSLLIHSTGEIIARYDKIHLFDAHVPGDRSYAESDRFLGGAQAVVAPLATNHQPPFTLGMTICYDVRFPYLYRALAKRGATILSVPSAFTVPTGEAHWHVLLRARAIENGCYVIAPAQCGTHPGERKTYGHSLIVDPWGKILADGGTEPGIVMAELDLAEVARIRARLPSLEHDREFS